MRLSHYSDYSLRVLLYLGAREDERATIAQIAAAYDISANHLMKVVHHLAQRGYVETVRGKGGGMRLARAPEDINVGELVRATEDNSRLAECFDRETSCCRIESACRLRGILRGALESFFRELDRHTLAELLAPRAKLARLLSIPAPIALRRVARSGAA
jgi:Rrf2 family transcriptional regulator, nitric oxide-sensitive transcriptional repressor